MIDWDEDSQVALFDDVALTDNALLGAETLEDLVDILEINKDGWKDASTTDEFPFDDDHQQFRTIAHKHRWPV